MKFYSLLPEYVCEVLFDCERADGEKCLELLSHDVYTVIKEAVFAELSATWFLSHSLSLYIALSHSLSLSYKGRDLVPLSNAGFFFYEVSLQQSQKHARVLMKVIKFYKGTHVLHLLYTL